MKKLLLALVVFTWSAPLALLHGQSTNSLRDQLVGTWRLVSSTQRLADGTVKTDPQTGPHGVGYIVYTESGRMCVVIGNPERSRWASVQAPTDKELRNAFDGLVTYAGTFEVNEAERYVVHHVEVDKVPNGAGTDRKRFCSLSGNRLTLRAGPPLSAGVTELSIVWERVGK
jgi:hypothetical protein